MVRSSSSGAEGRPRSRSSAFSTLMALVLASTAAVPVFAQTLLFSDGFEGPSPMTTNWDAGQGNCRAVYPSAKQSHAGTTSLYYDPNNPSWYCTASGAPYTCCTGPATGTCDTSGNCNHYFPAMNDFYLSYWVYPNANFNVCAKTTAGLHMWRMYGPVIDFDNLTHFYGSGCTSSSALVLESEPIFSTSDTTYYSALPLTRGQWNRVEVLFRQGLGNTGSYLMEWVTDGTGTHPWNVNGGQPVTNVNYNGGTAQPFDHFSVVTNYDQHDSTTNWYTDDVEIWTGCPPTGAACSTGADSTPPVRSSGLPSGSLPSTTTQTTLTLLTNENATCKYSTTAGTAYASMSATFSTTGSTSHSTSVSGLTSGTSYTYYVRCNDADGNTNTDDYPISFAVSSTSTAGSSCSNPPPGTIFCDDFEDTNIASRYTDYGDGSGRFVPTTAEAHGGTHAMSARYDPGVEQSGYLWYNFGRNPAGSKTQTTTDFTELYWRVWMKVQTGFQGNPMKLTRARLIAKSDYTDAATGHLWDGSSLNLALDPATGVAPDGHTLMTSGYNDFNHYTWLGLTEGKTQVYDSSHQGRWQCIEVHMKLNTPGKSDGLFEFWVDGNLDAQKTGLNFRGSFTDYGINHVTLENWWNNGAAPQTEYRYLDDFMVSTQRIGCGGSDTTPPPNVGQVHRTDQH